MSGFLITHLLIKEKSASSTIQVKRFYIRRILRIWPLYYLITFIAFFLLNNSNLFGSTIADRNVLAHAPYNLLLYIFFLPNVAWWLSFSIQFANQLWSVGVEEQFYLFWPYITKYLGKRKQLLFMAVFVVAFIATKTGLSVLSEHFHERHLGYFAALLTITRIDCMAIGGLAAHALYYRQTAVLQLVSSRWADAVVAVITLFFIFFGYQIPFIRDEFCSVLFAYIILSASSAPRSLLTMESKTWSFLGTLSYGIYMWHMVVIAVLLFYIQVANIKDAPTQKTILYGLAFPFTICVSWLSYNCIEKPFLRLKERFAVVQSVSAQR